MGSLFPPLNVQVPIVDKGGNPTPFFQRLLQKLSLAAELTVGANGAIGIANGSILNAMLANMASKTIKGNKEATAGPPEDLTLSQVLDLIGGATWGDVLFRGTAGWQRLAAGAAGQFLKTNGAGADPVWAAPGGGGSLVLLEQHTAAASASLNFAASISATYDEYLIEFLNVLPATNTTKLFMRMSTNAGATYDAGANYSFAALSSNRFATSTTGADSGAAQIQLMNSSADNTVATGGICGSLRLFSPGSPTQHKGVRASLMFVTSGTLESCESSGFYRSLTAVNAFQFLMSAGNIASGTIRVYGVAKA